MAQMNPILQLLQEIFSTPPAPTQDPRISQFNQAHPPTQWQVNTPSTGSTGSPTGAMPPSAAQMGPGQMHPLLLILMHLLGNQIQGGPASGGELGGGAFDKAVDKSVSPPQATGGASADPMQLLQAIFGKLGGPGGIGQGHWGSLFGGMGDGADKTPMIR